MKYEDYHNMKGNKITQGDNVGDQIRAWHLYYVI